jgi:hypothetical protein
LSARWEFRHGYLLDTRHGSGLYGKLRMSSLENNIAKKDKEAGGDAVIFMTSESQKYFGKVSTRAIRSRFR